MRFCVVGIDPSKNSTGWCVLDCRDGEWSYVDSGQCAATDAPTHVRAARPAGSSVRVLAVEGIFPGAPAGRPDSKRQTWSIGFTSGRIAGNLEEVQGFDEAELWVPQPNEWRDALKIKRGARDAVARRVLRFARDATGVEMEGPRGGIQVDRAMAVGIAYAAALRAGR